MCALLGTAASQPVAEGDLRFARSADAEAEAKAEPEADALRPFAYSSPAGAVSFSLGAVRIHYFGDLRDSFKILYYLKGFAYQQNPIILRRLFYSGNY